MSRLAIDIGGTWLRYELKGDEEVCGRVRSNETGLKAFIQAMLKKHPDIDKIAVSYAGQVFDGSILSAPNIEVDEPDIADWAEARYGIELILENDLSCAALAESVYWGESYVAALYAGTGLGAGIVQKGEICRGFRGIAGEIGHVPFKPAPFRCGCGKNNCLELYASGGGLAKWREYLGCDIEDLGQMAQGDDPCRQIAAQFTEALLHAAATLLTLCNPKILVLGGGVVAANPWLIDMLKTRIADYALAASLEGARIEISHLSDASLEGAKILLEG